MTEKHKDISMYKINHRTYGGIITPFDFDGHNTMTSIASKIARDFDFDRQCEKTAKCREINKNYKEN